MFGRSTIFVLGAGASWHYGYPTGEQLVLDIIDLATRLKSECERHSQERRYSPAKPPFGAEREGSTRDRTRFWKNLGEQCGNLIHSLETVRPLVIDYFLGWNPSLQDIGRLLIAGVILKCEAEYLEKRANTNRAPVVERLTEELSHEQLRRINIKAFKDNWYRFVVHKLATNCKESSDILLNQVHFVTFNYDYSLENYLRESLSTIDLFEAGDIENFLSNNRILHVYGCIRQPLTELHKDSSAAFLTSVDFISLFGEQPNPYESPWLKFLQDCHAASQGIRTIDPHDKESGDVILNQARQRIEMSADAFILGYGFDENNNRRIGLNSLANQFPAGRQVYFTNFGDANTVNRKVGGLFGNYRSFFGEYILSGPTGNRFEKSVRNVYEALELDFGMA